MSFKQASLMTVQLVACFFALMTVSAGSAMAASKIAYTCDITTLDVTAEEICTMNRDGSESTQLTSFQDNGISVSSPTWSPDGSQIAFIVYDISAIDGQIYVMDSDGSNLVSVVPAIAVQEEIQWSPELPASVASISPFGQFVVVFVLGGITALWMTGRRPQRMES